MQQTLLQYLETDKEHTQQYKKMLENSASGIAEFAVEEINHGVESYTIISKTITSCLENFQECEKFTNGESIKEHLPEIDTIDIKINAPLLDSLFAQKYSNQDDEWLDGDEIKELLQKITNLENVREHITVIDDIDHLNLLGDFKNAQTKWGTDNNYFHIFIIGTMSQLAGRKSGHWFLLVAQKINGEKYYSTADSMGTDRSTDKRIKKIIKFLCSKN